MSYNYLNRSGVANQLAKLLIIVTIFNLGGPVFAVATDIPSDEQTVSSELSQDQFSGEGTTDPDPCEESEGSGSEAKSCPNETDTLSVLLESPEDSPIIDLIDLGNPEQKIDTMSSATSVTQVIVSAESGGAEASGDTAIAVSGQATAHADVFTVVNTDIIDSTGLVTFINETLGHDDFDMRSDFAGIFTNPQSPVSDCLSESCIVETDYSSVKYATITNDVAVSAVSGQAGADGQTDAYAVSGDTYATANVINLANTTIVDSQYLLLIFNNFDDYAGDIILPGGGFFNQLFASAPVSTPQIINIENDAIVNDNYSVSAVSGSTTATGGFSNSGNSFASGYTSNSINQTLIGGTSFSMLIKVHGDWTGSISDLPDGLAWRETPQGIEIFALAGTDSVLRPTSALLSNTANLTNNVQVYALSGDSQAQGENALAVSGDTYANASVMNMVNTNVISSNWTNLIFTIYGNWSGDLLFGQPDLWLGIRADAGDPPLMPGSEADLTFTVFNRGDATAKDVTLTGEFDPKQLSFTDQTDTWSLGDITAGETREFTKQVIVSRSLSKSIVNTIPVLAKVTSQSNEADKTNNEDRLILYAGVQRSSNHSTGKTIPARFEINKQADRTTVKDGDTVTYTIDLLSKGGKLFDALLVDTLLNEEGEVVVSQSWPLGDIRNGESIKVEYQIAYSDKLKPGRYNNVAQLIGLHQSNKRRYQVPYESSTTSVVVMYGETLSQVLGASDSICQPYLTTHLHRGWDNDSDQVKKLQVFLNANTGSQLPVTGFFGPATELAVKRLQTQYRTDILDPWGGGNPTGFVYYTTKKKINELACEHTQEFPLSSTENDEILTAKVKWQATEWLGW